MFTPADGERKHELGCSHTREERERKGPGGVTAHTEEQGGCGVLLTQEDGAVDVWMQGC